jgi:hypothetical protein
MQRKPFLMLAARASAYVRPWPPASAQQQAARSLEGVYTGLVWSMTMLALVLLENQALGQPPCPPALPPYQSLRYDEEYTFLRNPSCRTDVWDPVKYIPLNEKGDWFLSLGGEAWLRYEYFHNAEWGQGPQDDGFLLQRYMAHADLHLGPSARLFVQLKSALENGRDGDHNRPSQLLSIIMCQTPKPWFRPSAHRLRL